MADLGNPAVISPTDASNGSGTMPSWLGSAAPSTLDDAGRALQGAVAREWENRSFVVTSTGTAPAFVITYTVAPAAYRSGQVYSFIAHAAAVGAETGNINALGAKNIKKLVAGAKTAIAASDWNIGDFIMTAYDGTDLVWVNRGIGASAATTTQQLTGTATTVSSTPDSVAALWEAGADIADGATITIGEGGYFNLITSTTAITAFTVTTDKAGRTFRCRFNTVRTLTHSGTALILPGAANITTAAGDIAQFRSLGTGTTNVVCEWYTKADGTPIAGSGVAATQADQETGTSTTTFVSPGRQQFHLSALKFYAVVTANGTTLSESFNVTSKTDTGLGDLLITINADFSTATWCALMGMNGTISVSPTNAGSLFPYLGTKAAGTIQLLCKDGTAGAADPNSPWSVAGAGDQV